MFGHSIGLELKRRLKGVRNHFVDSSSSSDNTSSAAFAARKRLTIAQKPTPFSGQQDGKQSHTLDLGPSLTGKLRTSSRRDLLVLENASLAAWVDLLEEENRQLERLVEAGDSVETCKEVHDQLHHTHQSLQKERQQAAVDLVEFIFRSLNASPPRRNRTDTHAVHVAVIADHSNYAPRSAHRDSLSIDDTFARSLTELAVPGGDIGPALGAPAPSSLNRRRISSIVHRGSVLIQQTAVESWNVLKVNRLRNTPHMLEVDVRTHSLIVKAANGQTKVELTAGELRYLNKSERKSRDLTIVYNLISKSSGRPKVYNKTYRFAAGTDVNDFCETVTKYVLQAGTTKTDPTDVSDSTYGRSVSSTQAPFSPSSSMLNSTLSMTSFSGLAGATTTKLMHMPEPYATSHLDLPSFVEENDVVDALAANLQRNWMDNKSKDMYAVDDQERPSYEKYRLREQLGMFMGSHSTPFSGTSYVLAERLLKMPQIFDFEITDAKSVVGNSDDSGSSGDGVPTTSSGMPDISKCPQLAQLVRQLAVQSHEIWCRLCLRSAHRRQLAWEAEYGDDNIKHDRTKSSPFIDLSSMKELAVRSNRFDSTASAYSVQSDMASVHSAASSYYGASPITELKSNASLSSLHPPKPVFESTGVIVPYIELSETSQKHHMDDATDIVRTLHEAGLTLRHSPHASGASKPSHNSSRPPPSSAALQSNSSYQSLPTISDIDEQTVASPSSMELVQSPLQSSPPPPPPPPPHPPTTPLH
jgi:hypothetical protein